MRVLNLEIKHWRNLRDVVITPPDDARLVCLVGENGTGKSNVLELLSAVAHRFGLSPGLNSERGNLFQEHRDFAVTVQLALEPVELFGEALWQEFQTSHPGFQDHAGLAAWDGTLNLAEVANELGEVVTSDFTAGGVSVLADAHTLANHIVNRLQMRQALHYVFLDANRAYPTYQVPVHQLGEAMRQPWDEVVRKKTLASQATRERYEQWMHQMVGREVQTSTAHSREARAATAAGVEVPAWSDPLAQYREYVAEVLPHLTFFGIHESDHSLLFDSAGTPLPFHKLSSGEKELAFLIGQVEMFGLRHGLFLLDEPELHLSHDMLRRWLMFLEATIDTGQVWFGTHAIEAPFIAGTSSTFFFERDAGTRLVNRISTLENRPAIKLLLGALGAPGFSVYGRSFVFVEGEKGVGEAEWFTRLCAPASTTKFVDGGDCKAVKLKVATLSDLDAEDELVIGGVVDRDFHDDDEVRKLEDAGLHVLGCHEVENLFLHPTAVQHLVDEDESTLTAGDVIRQCADHFAGHWILHRAVVPGRIDPSTDARKAAHRTWQSIEPDVAAFTQSILDADPNSATWSQHLSDAAQEYQTLRSNHDELWKACFGKQSLSRLPSAVGLASVDAVVNRLTRAWSGGTVARPAELDALRAYVGSLV